jgi:hypothetical protein
VGRAGRRAEVDNTEAEAAVGLGRGRQEGTSAVDAIEGTEGGAADSAGREHRAGCRGREVGRIG